MTCHKHVSNLAFPLDSLSTFLGEGCFAFNSYQVTLEESKEKNEKLRLPAVTLCTYPGWVNSRSSQSSGYFKWKCPNATTADEFLTCIKKQTYSFGDLVKSATHGVSTDVQKNLSDFKLWTWDMTVPSTGRCYTINYDSPVGVDIEKDILLIALKNTKKPFYVFLHEPHFLAIAANLLAMPTYFQLDPEENKAKTLILEAIRWQRLNRPEAPCNPSPDYNFTDCVIESKARKIGCTLPWNRHVTGKRAFD